MSAHWFVSFSAPDPNPGRRRRRPKRSVEPRRSPAVGLDRRIVAALAELPTATPTVGQLAAALGLATGDLARTLAGMDRHGRIERWPDPESPGVVRVMLSARSADRLGLVLDRRGQRWEPRPA